MSEGRRRKTGNDAAERPRGGRPRAVSEMLPDIGRASFRRFGFVQSAVVSRWAEIVGSRFAGVSTPESIRFPQGKRAEGVLTLGVALTPGSTAFAGVAVAGSGTVTGSGNTGAGDGTTGAAEAVSSWANADGVTSRAMAVAAHKLRIIE